MASFFAGGILTTAAAALLLLLADVHGWELEDLKEMSCLKEPPTTSPELDQKWMQSVDTWYYNHANKLDLYRTVADALNVSVSEVNEADAYYKACVTINMGNGVDEEPEFNAMGKTLKFKLKPRADGSFETSFANLDMEGVVTMPLTDNKSYIFFYACWADDTTTWGTISAKPVLSKRAVRKIHAYARSLGFLDKHFTYLRFDTCNMGLESESKPDKIGRKIEL